MMQSSSSSEAFVFARNFDAEVAQEIAARASEGPKTYSEADLARATAEAEAKGHAAGLAEGHASGRAGAEGEIAAATAASLEALVPMVTGYAHAIDRIQSTLQDQMVTYATGLCETLFPQLLDQFGADRVTDQISALVTRLQGRAELTIHVPADVAEDVQARLPQLTQGTQAKCTLTVAADPALTPGQARVSWADGFAEIDQAALTRAILRDLHTARAANAAPVSQPSEQE